MPLDVPSAAGPTRRALPHLARGAQENNAIATLDVASGRITAIHPLGLKDHSASPMDASDK